MKKYERYSWEDDLGGGAASAETLYRKTEWVHDENQMERVVVAAPRKYAFDEDGNVMIELQHQSNEGTFTSTQIYLTLGEVDLVIKGLRKAKRYVTLIRAEK